MGRKKDDTVWPVQKTEAEWREQLSDEQFYVTRQAGTERAFPALIGTVNRTAHIIVCAAMRRFSKAARNMIAALAGPASGSQCHKQPLPTALTIRYL